VYNTRENGWRQVASYPCIIHHPGVAAVGKRLYVVGGNGLRINAYSRVCEYDPRDNVWRRKRDMPTARGALGVAVVNDLIYAVGGAYPVGWKAKSVRRELEVYDPKAASWRTLEPMPTAREHLAVAASGELIFALGGYVRTMHEPLRCNEVYNSATGTWETRAPLPLPLCGFPAVGLKDSIFIFGGEQGWAVSQECYEYRIPEDRWYRRPDMSTPRYAAVAAVVGEEIHVIGGKGVMYGYVFSQDHEIFRP
jgi:N-acetylneuraminic acid mutarotase